jgi:hypothetical protein
MGNWSCAACGAMTDDLFATCAGCREPRPPEAGWPDAPTLGSLTVAYRRGGIP